MDKLENVISRLAILRTWAAVNPNYEMGLSVDECKKAVGWLDEAIDMLKAQQARVLSAEELEHMEPGNVIWIERELLDHSRLMDYGMRIDTDDGPWFRTDDGGAINPMTPDEDYIRSRCWTSRPTPEQREATPWASDT